MPGKVFISRQSLLHNLQNLQQHNLSTGIIPVLKANSYGHDAHLILSILKTKNLDYVAFAHVNEALSIKKNYPLPILILGANQPQEVIESLQNHFTASLSSKEDLLALDAAKFDLPEKTKIHIKFNIGMNRAGISAQHAQDFFIELKKILNTCPHIELEAVYSHLTSSEIYQHPATEQQIALFNSLVDQTQKIFEKNIKTHLFNSGAFIHYPKSQYTWARVGIALYGIYDHDSFLPKIDLKPVLSWQAPIINFHRIEAGEGVSYNQTFIAQKSTNIATVGIGYGDGYKRIGSHGKFSMLYQGKLRKVVGRICMDMTMIDLEDDPVKIGDSVWLLGKEGKTEIAANDLAKAAQTNAYEILCSLTARNVWTLGV